jgi:ATP-binding cassette subfamily B (MDR/TAP) protein 1
MAQAIAGFVIAFTRGWLLALVLMSCLPLLVLSGALMMMRMTKLATEGQAAYAEAGSLVEQVSELVVRFGLRGFDGSS